MKKWMVIELVALAILLTAALTVGVILARPVLFPDSTATTLATQDNTIETTQSIATEETTGTTEATQESTGETVSESTGETVPDSSTEPAQSEPTAPTPTVSKPTEPKPTEPKPTEPKPTAPTQESTAPTETIPVESTAPAETTPPESTAPEERQILARQYFVYDVNANTFLTISGQVNDKIYPASITKLLTVQVALQYLQPEEEITAGKELEMVSWDASIAKIKQGDTLTVRQLIAGMLLPSGNDAAHILACHTGRLIAQDPELEATVAVAVFVEDMNAYAASKGMTGSHFVNPDGMHDTNHYTTFADLVTLSKLSLDNELIVQYAATRQEEITLHEETIVWKNTNRLIDPSSTYYCPYAMGLKTGQTSAAGSCLLSTYSIEDQQLIIGAFGCPAEKDRFEDTLQLFQEWFSAN